MVIRHLELFSGVGGFRQAMELLCRDFGMQSLNIGFSEIEPNAVNTYKANFKTDDEIEMGDIVSFVSNQNNINNLPNFDLLTGGFPCQSFSMMGQQKGFKDMRGNVFFQIMDIIKIKQPRFVLLENVKNIITHNKGTTFEIIIKSIKEAGYNYIYHDVFNSRDFALAQNRNRAYIFASKASLGEEFKFMNKKILDSF